MLHKLSDFEKALDYIGCFVVKYNCIGYEQGSAKKDISLNGGNNMAVLTITKDNFKTEVVESDKPVLLDFWASWCAPCMMQSPIVDELAEEHPELKVGKVNVDEQPQLAAAFGVESIPTLVIIKDGITKEVLVGLHRKEQILEQFN